MATASGVQVRVLCILVSSFAITFPRRGGELWSFCCLTSSCVIVIGFEW